MTRAASLPSPRALRLVGAASRAPRPPLGLKAWSDDAQAIAIALDAADERVSVADVARQLPDPSTLAPGTLVVVLGEAAGSGGLLARFRRQVRVARAVRGSALLARGYARAGGGLDPESGADLAWAWSAER